MSPRPPRTEPDFRKLGALVDRLDAGPNRRCAVPECLHRPAGMGASRAMQALSAAGERPGSALEPLATPTGSSSGSADAPPGLAVTGS